MAVLMVPPPAQETVPIDEASSSMNLDEDTMANLDERSPMGEAQGTSTNVDASDAESMCSTPPQPPASMGGNTGGMCSGRDDRGRIKDLTDPDCSDFDLRDRDGDGFSDESYEVSIDNVVVTGVFGSGFTVQDLDGGPYSGLYVFTNDAILPRQIQPGTRVRLRGQLMEHYTLRELQVRSIDEQIDILSQGELPEPVYVADPSLVADGGYLADQFESMLIEIRNVVVIGTAPDCPREFDMFVVTGNLRIEDEVGLEYDPSRGDFIPRAMGVLHYSFEHQKLRPVRPQDLETIYCGGRPDKCEATECSAEIDAPEIGGVVIVEIQDNPLGRDSTREYVEILNVTQESVDLDGWTLENCAGRQATLTGRLGPNNRHVVGGNTSGDDGGARSDDQLDDLALSNGEGSLLLYDASGTLVDQVRYGRDESWPARENGYSLELRDPSLDNRQGTSWQSATVRYGDGGWGTPGQPRRSSNNLQ